MSNSQTGFNSLILMRFFVKCLHCIASALLAALCILTLALVIEASAVFRDGHLDLAELSLRLNAELVMARDFPSVLTNFHGFVISMANSSYEVLFNHSGLAPMATRFAQTQALHLPDSLMRQFFVAHPNGLYFFMLVSLRLAVKLAYLIDFLPLMVLLGCLAGVDGLMSRRLRRESAGRDSSTHYQAARRAQIWVFWSLVLVCLLYPGSEDPRYMGYGGLGLWCICLHRQCVNYKKF